MNHDFEQLKHSAELTSLHPALHSICSRYGSVARLDILAAVQAGRHQALCFLRMDSPEQEQQLMHALGARRFGGEIVLVMELQPASPATATRVLAA
jgi:hypothetical protein